MYCRLQFVEGPCSYWSLRPILTCLKAMLELLKNSLPPWVRHMRMSIYHRPFWIILTFQSLLQNVIFGIHICTVLPSLLGKSNSNVAINYDSSEEQLRALYCTRSSIMLFFPLSLQYQNIRCRQVKIDITQNKIFGPQILEWNKCIFKCHLSLINFS